MYEQDISNPQNISIQVEIFYIFITLVLLSYGGISRKDDEKYTKIQINKNTICTLLVGSSNGVLLTKSCVFCCYYHYFYFIIVELHVTKQIVMIAFDWGKHI